jgi:hypothetical protein
MANEEHLALLQQGVEVWNAWRKRNWEVSVDLACVNLRGANLQGANQRFVSQRRGGTRGSILIMQSSTTAGGGSVSFSVAFPLRAPVRSRGGRAPAGRSLR